MLRIIKIQRLKASITILNTNLFYRFILERYQIGNSNISNLGFLEFEVEFKYKKEIYTISGLIFTRSGNFDENPLLDVKNF